MNWYYVDVEREALPDVLPDVEVFYRSVEENAGYGWFDDEGEPFAAGWYYWYCLPGCLPDSEPIGPYASEAEAIEAARDAAGF